MKIEIENQKERGRLAGLLKHYRNKVPRKEQIIPSRELKELLYSVVVIDEIEDPRKEGELQRYSVAIANYHQTLRGLRESISRLPVKLSSYFRDLYDKACENSIPWGNCQRLNGQSYRCGSHTTSNENTERAKYEPDLPSRAKCKKIVGEKPNWRKKSKKCKA